MSRKKRTNVLLICGLSVSLAAFYSYAPPPPPTNIFEQHPPIATNLWVQQIRQPSDGNNIMVRVRYRQFGPMPLQIPVYVGSNSITIYDDGTHGDASSQDGIYTGSLRENIPAFINKMNNRVNSVNAQITSGTGMFTFSGHLGTKVNQQVEFDARGFSQFASVSVNPILVSAAGAGAGAGCSTSILRENSLFITDLSVVEDPARTFNVVTGAGNPNGVWTFGNLISNMAGGGGGVPLIQSWLQHFINPITVNGQTVPGKPFIIPLCIEPWLQRCGIATPVNASNWIALMNSLPPSVVLENAPFKLTAIVNRLDLRGNSGYSGSVSNSGETRFIFTLIDPNHGHPSNGGMGQFLSGLITGEPPIQTRNDFSPKPFYDWRGMNVIFEYGNTQNNLCDVVDFANQWVNLSNMPLGDPGYLAALEAITHTVIDAGMAPSKPNQNAINRIRTNERIFDAIPSGTNPGWAVSDWEFRQFELDAGSGLFDQVPLTNTPVNEANGVNTSATPEVSFLLGTNFTVAPNPLDQANLMNWAFSTPANLADISAGNHSIPATFGGRPLLAGGARVDMEFLHYLDLDWDHPSSAPNYAPSAPSVPGSAFYKQVRQQISLNTCQGCHAGETQTMFTHVAPIGYGTPATYWNSTPDFTTEPIDSRFTTHNTAGIYDAPPTPENIVRVSAFLTGRNFRSAAGFNDDVSNPADDALDNTMDGLYYVNAPDNYPSNTIGLTQQFGYNDLLRRQQDLCMLASTDCTAFSVFGMFQAIMAIPLPLGGH